MINAQELRIGNCVYDQYGKVRFISHRKLSDIASNPDSHGYKPIPITAEWLRRLGFANDNDKTVFAKDNLKVGMPGFGGPSWVFYFDKHLSLHQMAYVHQLQNLYFALTCEELKVNHLQP